MPMQIKTALYRFSIVVPISNSESYLERCLRSLNLLDFPHDNFEVIFVDDASNDNSMDLLKSTLKSSAPVFNHKIIEQLVATGPGGARNIGLENCNGEWVIFLDSDDALESQILSVIDLHISNSDNNNSLELVLYDGELLIDDSDETHVKFLCKHQKVIQECDPRESYSKIIRSSLRLESDEHVIFSAFKTEMLRKFHITFSTGIYEDSLFMTKSLLHSNRISHIENQLYKKYRRVGQITGSFTLNHAISYLRVRSEIWKWVCSLAEENQRSYKSDFEFGIRGVLGIIYRDSAKCFDTQQSKAFDFQVTDFARTIFNDFHSIMAVSPTTELDIIAISRYQELKMIG